MKLRSLMLAITVATTGLTAAPGFVYAVYEDVARSQQNIAFLCPAGAGQPRRGTFVDLARDALTDITDPAMLTMLERLADESRMGNYGVYFGSHKQGQVTRKLQGTAS